MMSTRCASRPSWSSAAKSYRCSSGMSPHSPPTATRAGRGSVIGCGNGTDAIALALRGLGIGPGSPHEPPYDTELAQGVAAESGMEVLPSGLEAGERARAEALAERHRDPSWIWRA